MTSANTSRKQVPALHRYLIEKDLIETYSTVLDYGCGKYDLGMEFLIDNLPDIPVSGYDPYNRPEWWNKETLARGPFSDIILANVLNVIESADERSNVLKHCYDLLDYQGTLWIGVYKAKKAGPTRDGYQTAMHINEYIPELEWAGFKVERVGPYIKATKG